MALIDWSEGGDDPRIREWVMREDISLAAAPTGGEHRGSVDIPLGVKIEAMLIEVMTAISGGSVTTLDFGISNDSPLFFQSGSTKTLTAGSRYFSIFEYAGLNLFDGHNVDPGFRFIGEGDAVHGADIQGSNDRVRSGSSGTSVPENNARVTLYTKQVDGTAAATTAGKVFVTVYGTRYIF